MKKPDPVISPIGHPDPHAHEKPMHPFLKVIGILVLLGLIAYVLYTTGIAQKVMQMFVKG